MTELEQIAYARRYLEQMALGINPLDGKAIPEGELLHNVRITRCLMYVSEILRTRVENAPEKSKNSVKNGEKSVKNDAKNAENGAKMRKKRTKKPPFSISPEAISRYAGEVDGMTMAELGRRITALAREESPDCKRLSSRPIADFLLATGMLTHEEKDGKTYRIPTEAGASVGFFTEERVGKTGYAYRVLLLDEGAQQFVLDHIDAIASAAEENQEITEYTEE